MFKFSDILLIFVVEGDTDDNETTRNGRNR